MTEQQWRLIRLLSDGRPHPAQELADRTDSTVDQVAAWASQLSEFGLRVNADRQDSYQLARRLELLDADYISALLPPQCRQHCSIQLWHSIDSSNQELVRQLDRGASSGTTCLAEHQSAGRGRQGRSWQSPFGVNLYCSMLWKSIDNGQLGGLSLALGVAACEALTAIGVSQVQLKWPNDLIVNGEKLGGILIQICNDPATGKDAVPTGGPAGQAIIAGIGINGSMPAHSAKKIDQPWTDLQTIGPSDLSRNRLAAAVIEHWVGALALFTEAGLEPFLARWAMLDALDGQPIRLLLGDQQLDGIARGVAADGCLRCEMADRKIRMFSSGEVSVRRARGHKPTQGDKPG